MGVATVKTPAAIAGYACTSVNMPEGSYIVEASAHLMGQYDESSETLDASVLDMISVNNDYSFDIEVVNFAPEILTISSSPDAAVVGDTITVSATAFDVEGDLMQFTFSDGTGAEITCEDNGISSPGECMPVLQLSPWSQHSK